MLLLDEAQEVLTLVTNSLQHDLAHSNQFIVGLALCTLGNIAGQEMSRDLCNDIEKLLGSTNSYIRKKAALCAMRIIRRVPELQENFMDRSKVLLADRHHGVLLCGITLATDICEEDPDAVSFYKPGVPALVKTLKSLITSGFAPEHDVTGIADPFLQIKIIRFLGVLGRGDAETSESINDILTQVASNTESVKNVGNAILYQAVLTILELEADSGLRVLGVNLLGKFLANKDNNIRYVALNTLHKVIEVEPNAVQRHRSTILECLRDPDISIRRRALDLSFALINESNIRVLIRELLAFLEVANNEFKLNMTTQICIAADRYAPNKRWHIDTVLRVLRLAGNFVREEILSSFIRLVATSPDLQVYTTRKLYLGLQEDISQEAMTLAGSWTIGEYSDSLLSATDMEPGTEMVDITSQNLVELLDSILQSAFVTPTISEYAITALIKISVRCREARATNAIKSILQRYTSSANVEIQQRALEYGKLFDYDSVREGVLERMPAPEIKEENRVLGPVAKAPKHRKKKSEVENLLDLLGEGPAAEEQVSVKSVQNSDLLQDLFSTNDTGSIRPANGTSNTNDMMDLFGMSSPQETQAQERASNPAVNQKTLDVLDRDDLSLRLQYKLDSSDENIKVVATILNRGTKLENLVMQAAVPKSMKLQLQSLSSTELDQGQSATQSMRITAKAEVGPPKHSY